MPRTKPDGAQTKDVWLTVPIEPRHNDLVKTAAKRESRSVSGWIRNLILQELKRLGLVDEEFNPIDETDQEEPLHASNG